MPKHRMHESRGNVFAAICIHLVAALALAACGDPSGTSGGRQGRLRFDYTGATAGSFQVEVSSQDTTPGASYALARTVPFGFEIMSRADSATPSGLSVRLVTNQTTPGRYPFAPICDMLSAARCAAGRLQFPVNPANGVGATFLLVTGELTITSSSGGRVRGTFSGTAQRSAASEIQVQNGEFDVPVLSP